MQKQAEDDDDDDDRLTYFGGTCAEGKIQALYILPELCGKNGSEDDEDDKLKSRIQRKAVSQLISWFPPGRAGIFT